MHTEILSDDIMSFYALLGSERDRLARLIKEYNDLNEKIAKLIEERERYESDIAITIGHLESCKYELQELKNKDALKDYRETLQQYINSMKDAFADNGKMEEEFGHTVFLLENELEERKDKEYDDLEFYKMKIAELDCILQWYGY